MSDVHRIQSLQRLGQASISPVQHVIIRQSATVYASGRETIDIPRMHPVMNSFSGPVRLRGRDSGLQINDPEIDAGVLEFLQRVAPDVIEAYRSQDRAMGFFGKIDILARVAKV